MYNKIISLPKKIWRDRFSHSIFCFPLLFSFPLLYFLEVILWESKQRWIWYFGVAQMDKRSYF